MYIETRERMGQLVQLLLTATEKVWRFWYGPKISLNFVGVQCIYSFSKSTKENFSVLGGGCHSPNTLPTMVHGQAFRIITDNTPPPTPFREAPYVSSIRDKLSSSVDLSPGNLTSTQLTKGSDFS